MFVKIPEREEADLAPSPGQQDSRDLATGTFLACLNHEIRTPLSGIMGMIELLLETALDEDQREYVQAARTCAESLFEILNATLDYSALEAGQFTLDSAEFSIRDMLDSAVAQHLPKAQAKGLSVSVKLDPGTPETAYSDASRIKDLIGHLVANAVKFTHTGSVEVRAGIHTDPDSPVTILKISVHDTGIGISPNRLESIFESFRQVETGLNRNYSGLGLGLAVARKLASLMRGNISVESTIGAGSTFYVDIPVRLTVKSASEPEPAWTRSAAASVGPRILAVDDNPVGLKVLRHILGRRHLDADCVGSGPEALRAAASQHYDLVLMDLQMPEMDGLTAAAELRKMPGFETVPIVALTANYSDQVREQCREHGMQMFLSKPVDAEELSTVLSRFLSPAAKS